MKGYQDFAERSPTLTSQLLLEGIADRKCRSKKRNRSHELHDYVPPLSFPFAAEGFVRAWLLWLLRSVWILAGFASSELSQENYERCEENRKYVVLSSSPT